MKRVLALAAVLLLLGAGACAQGEWTRSYGGSGADSLSFLIPAGDGLLAAGHTTSSDGDLSGRTRAGKAGWLLRLDGEGNPLWSCCTAHVGRNEMAYPYAHADGTFSAVLTAEGEGSEWLRISDRGCVSARIDLPEPQEACAHGGAAHIYGMPFDRTDAAMLALVVTHADGTICCAAMDETGQVFPGAVVAADALDGACAMEQDGGGRRVCVSPVDGDALIRWIEPGGAREIAPIRVPVESGKLQIVLCVLPCADGSVIFSGQLCAIGSVVMRVSAEGDVLFVIDDCGNYENMAFTSTGFAGIGDGQIVFYDEDGTQLGSTTHETMSAVRDMASLGDGVAVLEMGESAQKKPAKIRRVEDYMPTSEDAYGEAAYARAGSTLEYAEAVGDRLVLDIQDQHGARACVLLDAACHVASEGAARQKQPGVRLPSGMLSWEETPLGACVTLRDGQGGTVFETATPIHTAADRVEWLCAAQTADGGYLLGGRYLTSIIPNTERKQHKRDLTRDGLCQEGVIARLSADGVLQDITTIRDMGSVAAILPGETDADTLLLCARGDMTESVLSNLVTLDQRMIGVLPILLDAPRGYLLKTPQGSFAAGTQTKNGRTTLIVQPIDAQGL